MATGNFFPDILGSVQRVTALIDIAQLHSLAQFQRTAVRCFLPRYDTEQRGFTRAVGSDNADDTARWEREVEIFEQQLVAISLGQSLGLDHFGAEPFGCLDQD